MVIQFYYEYRHILFLEMCFQKSCSNIRRLILLCGAAADMSDRSDTLICSFGMFNKNAKTCVKSHEYDNNSGQSEAQLWSISFVWFYLA